MLNGVSKRGPVHPSTESPSAGSWLEVRGWGVSLEAELAEQAQRCYFRGMFYGGRRQSAEGDYKEIKDPFSAPTLIFFQLQVVTQVVGYN